MSLSTHVLDLERAQPAAGVPVVAEREVEGGWEQAARSCTGDDGRIADLVSPEAWEPGRWRLRFDTKCYFGPDALFPEIVVVLAAGTEHYHVPVLLSRGGYTTYRGS